MRIALALTAALSLLALAAAPADAQTIDKNGRCHDAAGKFAKAAVCAGLKGATAPSQTPGPGPGTETFGGPTATAGSVAPTNAPPYQHGDDKKPVKCRDAKGHFAKCSAPGAKPVT